MIKIYNYGDKDYYNQKIKESKPNKWLDNNKLKIMNNK